VRECYIWWLCNHSPRSVGQHNSRKNYQRNKKEGEKNSFNPQLYIVHIS